MKSYAREARERHAPVKRVRREKKKPLSPVSFTVFSLVPALWFDCSRVLEYAKIRTENLAKRSSLLRPFHHLLVNSEKIQVNENLATKVRSTIYYSLRQK